MGTLSRSSASDAIVPTALGVAFVATGASALVVEQAFEKLLSTVVGSSTQAGAIVLAVYFAGLSLGGVAYGRFAPRVRRPLRAYALLEGIVGVASLLLGCFFVEVQAGAAWLVQQGGDRAPLVFVARLFVAALWILPPTIAMGATYPAVVAVLQSLAARRAEAADHDGGCAPKPPGEARRAPLRSARLDRMGTAMARIYSANLLGAAVASFCAPYFVFPALGMTGALVAVALAQGCVVAFVLALARSSDADPPHTRAAVVDGPPASASLGRGGVRLVVALGFLSGFVIFGLEVLWIHLIGTTIGMSVYAFAMMLTLVLTGLFCGGVLVTLVSPRTAPQPAWLLPAFVVVASATTLVTGARWDRAAAALLSAGYDADTFLKGEIVRFGVAFDLVFWPSMTLGLVYPSLFKSRLFPLVDASRAAGVVGAANAIGSILGALVTGFVLLPLVGSEWSLRGLALAPALLAVPILGAAARRGGVPRWLTPLSGASALALAAVAVLGGRWNPLDLTSGVNVYFSDRFVPRSAWSILSWHEDAAGGITTVVTAKGRDERAVRLLLSNGKFQGNDGGEVADQIAFGLVPAALVAARDRALVVGVGTGQSAHVLGAAGFAHLDIADISEGMRAAAARHFDHINGRVLESPNVSFYLEDGRNFLLRTSHRYDLISIEITSIWFSGGANLYAREFYRVARERLAPGGVLQQWVQFHHAAPEEVMSILATVRAEFPFVTLWMLGSQGVIVASSSPHAPSRAVDAQLASAPELQPMLELLARRHGITLENLGERMLLDDRAITRIAASVAARGIPLNTDGNRYLEFATPRHNLEHARHRAIVLQTLLAFVDPAERAAWTRRFVDPAPATGGGPRSPR